MTRSEIVGGALLAGIGAYAAYEAYGFGLGTPVQPGAGFFPFGAGVLVIGCATGIVATDFARRAASESDYFAGSWIKISFCVAALLLFAVALPRIGFGLSTFILLLALSRLDHETSWSTSFVLAIAGAIGFWLVFVRWLGVSFPPSLFAL